MNVVRLARALAFGGPLAFLVGSFVSPPDPFSQLVLIGVSLLFFVPAAYVSVAESGDSRTLFVFYGVILATVILGSLVVNALYWGSLGRFVVLVAAVAAGTVAVDRLG